MSTSHQSRTWVGRLTGSTGSDALRLLSVLTLVIATLLSLAVKLSAPLARVHHRKAEVRPGHRLALPMHDGRIPTTYSLAGRLPDGTIEIRLKELAADTCLSHFGVSSGNARARLRQCYRTGSWPHRPRARRVQWHRQR